MKRTIISIIALACCLLGNAQTTKDEILANTAKAGGNYYPYPTPSGKLTPAPAGYEPFYISHYGRHGARFMSEDTHVKRVLKFLRENELNELGRETLAKLEMVDQVMKGKTGELTPLGYQQLTEIAGRMYANYPTVFYGDKKVEARSTYIPRSIISMSTFCLTLKGNNSALNITPIVSNTDMPMLNMDRVKKADRPKVENQEYQNYTKFCDQKRTKSDRLVQSLLKTPKKVKPNVCQDFGYSLFKVASAIQDMPNVNFTLFNLFTNDEIWDYWQAQNAFWYSFCGVYGNPNIRAREFGEELWRDIQTKADNAIAGKGNCLDLRFGHDTGMLPFLVMMDINHPMDQVNDLGDFYTKFADFKVIPMAGNVQFVFFKNAEGKVLVKVLVNEEEARLPLKATSGPYYDWADVKAHYNK